MKTIALLTVDFDRTPFGLPSRLNQDLRGETVLRRTLKRLRGATKLASVHLAVESAQEAQARAAVAGLDVAIETHTAPRPPWELYVASARKWSMDGWRGGLAGTTVYDEFAHPWVATALAKREKADAVVEIPAAAPLLDPALLDDIIGHFDTVRGEVRLAFTQSAPGLSAIVYQADVVEKLAGATQPPGRTLAYRPEDPNPDSIMQPCHYPTDAVVAHASGRCIADTTTAMERLEAILRELSGAEERTPDAVTVSRWLREHRLEPAPALPVEVEIELTTDDPLPHSILRPRGEAAGRRGPMKEATFERLIAELATRDDSRLVFGGHGDPLLHPEWPRYVRRAREAGIFAIALRTPAVTLDAAAIDALMEAKVDVLNVLLDAATPVTYQTLHGEDHFERVLAGINQVLTANRQRSEPRPLVVCEMMKMYATMNEMEAFYDHWIRRTGSAVIAGPSHYAGQWPDLAVMRMAPPGRFACQRVFQRAMVLADGRMTVCDQDFRGLHAVGSLETASLQDLWTSHAMLAARKSHRAGTYDGMPLCPRCEEWHRP